MNHFQEGSSTTISYDNSTNTANATTNSNAEMMSMEVMMENRSYKGVRQRRWGKWVSEIRVPGTRERLWLGSYRTAEAAAVAHDTALFCLHGCIRVEGLNFPMALPVGLSPGMSPKTIQKVASQAGMVIDAEFETQMAPDQVEAHDHDHNIADNHGRQYGLIQSVNGRNFWDGDQGDDIGCSTARMNEGGGSREEVGMSISVDDMEIYP